MSSIGSSSPSSTRSGKKEVPRLGGVRCYWALVSPEYAPQGTATAGGIRTLSEMRFVHLDPLLSTHLARQGTSMIGRGVFEFVHPAERGQACRDLTDAIAADDLQGSVTRVRIARINRIRQILGCRPPEENTPAPDANTYAEVDGEYLIVDLVLNWAADGLLLAFFHAIKDKDPVHDNDPKLAHEEWTNWCGTKDMDDEQIEALHLHISNSVVLPTLTQYPPTRVFQLHYTPPSPSPLDPPIIPPQLIFSWPPARAQGVQAEHDGQYNALEYCEMMRGVNMDPSQLNAGPGELRTNCTTRYGAQHSIATEGVYRHVMGVFIPYGSLIFACFQTTKIYDLAGGVSTTYRNIFSTSHPQTQSQNGNGNGYGHTAGVGAGSSIPANISNWAQDWSNSKLVNGHQQQPWSTNTADFEPSSTSIHDPTTNPTLTYPGMPSSSSSSSSSATIYAPHSSYSMDHMSIQPGIHDHHQHSHANIQIPSHSHPQNYNSVGIPVGVGMENSTSSDSLPKTSPNPNGNGLNTSSSMQSLGSSGGGGGGRPLVRPPGNVDCCVICGIRESPEWRRNESGIKDLCNACGLRLARQVAKREGRQKPRKKQERSSSASASASASSMAGMPS